VFKKVTFGALSLALGLSLAACGSDAQETSSSNSDTKTEETKPAEQKDVKNEPKKDENGNYVLEEVGQKATTDGATAELLKIKKINETINIAPLKVTLKDIKLIKLTDISEEMKNALTLYDITVNDGQPLYYVQVQFEAENTEERNIEWYDLMNVVTDKGEQIDGQLKDFIADDSEMDSVFLGKVKKEYIDGFGVKDPEISKVKLIFGNTMDSDSYEDITGKQQVEYSFE
jgi:hypothetical protein